MNAPLRIRSRRVAFAACVSLLVLAALAVSSPASATTARAKGCAGAVVNDWYTHKTKVVGHYPVSCYREALSSLENDPDIKDYTNALSVIQNALAAALLRDGGGPSGGSRLRPGEKPVARHNTYDFSGCADCQNASNTITSTAGASAVPVPLLVLGGLAALLLTAGGAGYVTRRLKGNRGGGTPAPDPADS